MKLGRVAVVGIALVAGVIAAMLALNLTRRPAPRVVQPAAVESTPAAQVLVATKDIRMGTTLDEGAVEWQDWPQSGASSNYLVKSAHPEAIKEIAGAIARATFYAGEPITETKLIQPGSGYMSAILPQGKRAVATKISADTSAGGFILPNDRVDVVMTYQTDGRVKTETILNNVRVLAIDQTVEEKDGQQVVVGQTATLELSPQQVEILTVAQQMSDRLTLALRSITDAEPRAADSAADATHLIEQLRKGNSVTVIKSGVAREVSGVRPSANSGAGTPGQPGQAEDATE